MGGGNLLIIEGAPEAAKYSASQYRPPHTSISI
jgi:hypothetical protein